MPYKPEPQSLRQHPVPAWFDNAKLGIFIHWGLFSVPGWAPLTGELGKVIEQQGWEAWFANNPYAEWYSNSLRIENSPTRQHHVETYGPDFNYDDLVPLFNAAAGAWNPAEWADLFRRAGARYVVPVTKHHDGFLLWPSPRTAPGKAGFRAERDIVGELATAVRAEGLRFGVYYSGGLDWTFNDAVIRDLPTLMAAVPQSPDYVDYATGHWRELIERYAPSIIWNDIGYPAAANVAELFADYYNTQPDGVINDRFRQGPPEVGEDGAVSMEPPATQHYDFRTPEYATYDEIRPEKWESTRGLGFSFGYNLNEDVEHHLPVDTLIRMFVDIVSKNGNLLLNVGPMADGTIPALQRERLEGLGQWLAMNGEAIYDTRPWTVAEARTTGNIGLRYTAKPGMLNVILLDTPLDGTVTIERLQAQSQTTVRLLGYDAMLDWKQEGDNLTITLPPELRQSPAHTFVLTPEPRPVSPAAPDRASADA